jgi:hypothetical protein
MVATQARMLDTTPAYPLPLRYELVIQHTFSTEARSAASPGKAILQ